MRWGEVRERKCEGEGGKGEENKLGSDLDPDPWQIFRIRIRNTGLRTVGQSRELVTLASLFCVL